MGLKKGNIDVDRLIVRDSNLFNTPPRHEFATERIVSDNYTLDQADCGKVIRVVADAKTITLPATVVGYNYTIVNDMEDGECLVTISPNANDYICGAELTQVDNKDLLNTKATAKKGDFVQLLGDGANGWMIVAIGGTWAKEA